MTELLMHDKLKPSGWDDKLKSFILSEDFSKILQKLESESLEGRRFVPQIKYLLAAFEKCAYGKLKVVIIGQDPYPYLNVPDGMASVVVLEANQRPVSGICLTK